MNEKITMVSDDVNRRIEDLEKDVKGYAKSMVEDYGYFFEWYAEDMYKAKLELKELRAMRLVMTTTNEVEVVKYIKAVVDGYTTDLLDRPLRRQSTSQMANLSQALWLDVEQKLRKYYTGILKYIEKTEQGEKVAG